MVLDSKMKMHNVHVYVQWTSIIFLRPTGENGWNGWHFILKTAIHASIYIRLWLQVKGLVRAYMYILCFMLHNSYTRYWDLSSHDGLFSRDSIIHFPSTVGGTMLQYILCASKRFCTLNSLHIWAAFCTNTPDLEGRHESGKWAFTSQRKG